MHFQRISLFVLAMGFLFFSKSLAQSQASAIRLRGTVADAETGEMLPFVSVSLKSRTAGAFTDTLGRFTLLAEKLAAGDSLQISYVGYTTLFLPISSQKKEQFFTAKIKSSMAALGEIVITADPNPGKTLMKKVIARNHENDPARFLRLDARRWSRSEVATFDPKLVADSTGGKAVISRGLFASRVRAFEKLRPQGDTLRGETPLFFMEKLADYTLKNHPFGENERILATKTTNLNTDKTLENLARWEAGSINLYENQVMLFSKAFVSPVGAEALGYYDFYILDSTTQANGFHKIRLQVIPKIWHGNVFTGIFTVEDSAYALIGADLRLSKAANLNFIESLSIHTEFAPAPDLLTGKMTLAPRESILTLHYEAGLDLLGIPLPAKAESKRIIARMTVIYDNVRLNDPLGAATPNGGLIRVKKSIDSGADDFFWTKNRPDTLSAHETAIYKMAENLRNDPKQRAKDKFFATITNAEYTFGNNLRLGPITSFVSTNPLEGARVRVGFGTMEGVSQKASLFGHVAYGFTDHILKGSIGLRVLPFMQPYVKTDLIFDSDYESLADQWYDELDRDNIANSVFRKNVPYNRTFIQKIALTQDCQLAGNFFLHGGMDFKKITPSFNFAFVNPDFKSLETTPTEAPTEKSIAVAAISVGLRFAWHETSKLVYYQREPIQSKYPTATLNYTRGFKWSFSDFNFQKIDIAMSHKTRLTPKAILFWNLEAGKVFGTLPTLLLNIPGGNDAYIMSRRVFNTMTPYEFAADRYASLHTRLAFGGMLFDRVPGLQKLGWRERLTFNAFWGDLSAQNKAFNTAIQAPIAANGVPFMEAGVGIENIFHLFSIDLMKRLNYLDSPSATGNRVGVYVGLKAFF